MENRPPQVNEVLIRIIKFWQGRGKRSAHIPVNSFDAAQWWIDMQEPPDEYRDKPQPTMNRSGEQSGWITPYHDRLAHNLRKFLTMPEPHKAFIIDNVRKGVSYRGDDIEFYKMVCLESEKMKVNPELYIQNAKKAGSRYLSQGDNHAM